MKRLLILSLFAIIWTTSSINAQSEEEVFRIVEEMPQFPGCEEIEDKSNRDKCATDKMLHFIYDQIKYPEEDVKTGAEGTGIVQFIVGKTGEIRDVNVVRGISETINKEMVRVVEAMPNWTPGKQRGKQVDVQFTLPIKFKLDEKKKEE